MPKTLIYPNSTPDFKMVQKPDGTTEMQVRYINIAQGYTGKWMPVKIENDNSNSPQT
jgi:hypothetical protein